MDKYFRAVGFSSLQAGKQLDSLIRNSFDTCESKIATDVNSDDISLDCFKYFGKGIGLGLTGKMNKNKSVILQKCFPFAESDYPVMTADVCTERLYEDKLIMFFDKKNHNQFVVKVQKNDVAPKKIKRVSITALSARGKVLLPLSGKNAKITPDRREAKKTKELLIKICAGDKNAETHLKRRQIEAAAAIKKRMFTEDYFSFVKNYFEPNEESVNSYDILADIINVETVVNSATDEKLYSMALDLAGTKLQAYINYNDLTGVPSKDMRFWGVCALNGNVMNTR